MSLYTIHNPRNGKVFKDEFPTVEAATAFCMTVQDRPLMIMKETADRSDETCQVVAQIGR